MLARERLTEPENSIVLPNQDLIIYKKTSKVFSSVPPSPGLHRRACLSLRFGRHFMYILSWNSTIKHQNPV